jgi:multiple sugar transport system permease protein
LADVTRPPRRHRQADALAGWTFTAPVIVILGVFLVVPVVMAACVSVSDWTGRGSPFAAGVNFVGAQNFREILVEPGLARNDFGISIRNNLYYVLFVVPLQTALSLFLAVMVNNRLLKGKSFFRVAFYFPSVTGSVAITILWLFLFSATGTVNKVLSVVSIDGPNWFNDPRGVFHVIAGALGVAQAPAAFSGDGFLGVSPWNWLAGPSVAMSAFIIMAVFTTSGTFMLLFLAALQNLDPEIDEAAMLDGAGGIRRFFSITVPQVRPTVFTVITLGLIGTWQVFDQIYTGTQGGPAKTTLTPAYLSFTAAFEGQKWGRGAAIAFILFFLIVALTVLQRLALREKPDVPRRRRRKGRGAGSAPGPGADGGAGAPAVLSVAAARASAPRKGEQS